MAALRAIAVRAIVLLALVVGLNLLVDPFDARGTRLFEPIVLGTRQPKLTFYRAQRPPPEIVILGSSRSFTMDPAYVKAKTGRATFNAAVHAGSPRDFLAFAGCMEGSGHFPSTLVVGLGVEHFRGPTRPAEPRDPLSACARGSATLGPGWRDFPPRFLSLEETWGSARVLGMEFTGRPRGRYASVQPDGWLLPGETKPLEIAIADSLAGQWSPAVLAGGEALDPAPRAEFQRFLDVSTRHGARVVVYLVPFHPRAIARYLAESHFAALRARLLEQLGLWAQDYPLRFHDFTEIQAFDGRPEDFLDASHPDAAGDRRIVDALSPELRR